jgi:hypothetical protein
MSDELEQIHKELVEIEKKVTSLQYLLQRVQAEVWRLKCEAGPPLIPVIEQDKDLDDFLGDLLGSWK